MNSKKQFTNPVGEALRKLREAHPEEAKAQPMQPVSVELVIVYMGMLPPRKPKVWLFPPASKMVH